MSLNAKILVFFSILMASLLLFVIAIGLYTLREFSLYTAERHALSVAETVKVGLTESMVNGTISKRPQFLERLRDVPGVEKVRVIRGPAVTSQFGPGIAQEQAMNEGDSKVIEHGQASFNVVDNGGTPVFHAIIPYTANSQGTPNCLQCHSVKPGTVLGAVAIDIPLKEVKQQAISTVAMVGLVILLTALLSLYLLYRLLRPLMETASAVKAVVTQAVGGVFTGRLKQRTSDEVGEIAGHLNRLMEFLDSGFNTIGQRVAELMGHNCQRTGNQLVATSEMVEGLVDAAQFKQAIEEDQNKAEVYQRLARVLQDKFDFRHFSIYEVAASKNRMTPVVVDGETDASCRWCNPEVLIDANACRVRRTGHEVNAVDFPGLCTMFRSSDDSEACAHICLPITQSGAAGGVVQLVMGADQGHFAKLLVPYIAVYLREAAPVLEAKRLMEHLRESSLRDAMTGLYNRRFLEEYVTTLVATSQRRQSPFSVLMLDLDYFKQVNDTFGHEAGDKVIKTLAELLTKSVRGSDMVVRYGGEEFLIVLQDSGMQTALAVADKIRTQVEAAKIQLPGTILQKTISIGVAEFPADSDTFWQVVKFADVALYEAKKQGRNRVVRFAPEMWQEETGKY